MTSDISFSPVPSQRNRADGWTPKKQIMFIEALADSGMVTDAASRAGMSRASAYSLKKKPGAESFAAAWDAAQQVGFEKLQDMAMNRAINGELIPYFFQGELVGERRRYDNRLLIFMMQQTLNRRYGLLADEARRKLAAQERAQEQISHGLTGAKAALMSKLNLMRSRMEANARNNGSEEEYS
jgi:hypothetical protein